MIWRPLLRRVSAHLLPQLDRWDLEDFLARHPTPDWLGYAPATEAQVAAAEARLGCALPSAFRSFLLTTNGWTFAVGFPNRMSSILGAQHISWLGADRRREHQRFRNYLRENPELLFGDSDGDLLDRLLLIGESDGSECILYVVGPGVDDWPILCWDTEDGFSRCESFESLMRRGESW